MKVKGALGCALIIMMVFLVAESARFPKSKLIAKNWGPQSMLYLKGRYGRRYAAASDEEQCYKLDLDDFDRDLKSYKRSAPLKFLNLGRRLTAQNMGIDYLD